MIVSTADPAIVRICLVYNLSTADKVISIDCRRSHSLFAFSGLNPALFPAFRPDRQQGLTQGYRSYSIADIRGLARFVRDANGLPRTAPRSRERRVVSLDSA